MRVLLSELFQYGLQVNTGPLPYVFPCPVAEVVFTISFHLLARLGVQAFVAQCVF